MTLFLGRTAMILLATASVAACTTYDRTSGGLPEPLRPNFPTQLAPGQKMGAALAALPPAAPASAPASANAASATERMVAPVRPDDRPPSAPAVPEPNYYKPVVTQAPVPAAQPRAAAPSTAPSAPAASRMVLARQDVEPPATRTVTRSSVTGKVVDAEGSAEEYTVKKGDTLFALGRKMGMEPEELGKLNGLKPPYKLALGQKLKGPRSKAKAYVVSDGDTLYAIARRFNISAKAIAEANDMGVGDTLRLGQKLVLPKGYRDSGPLKTQTQVPVEPGAQRPSRPEPRPEPKPEPRPPVVEPRPQPVEPRPQPPEPKPEPKPEPRTEPKPQPAPVQPRPAPPPAPYMPKPVPAPAPTPAPKPPAPKPTPAPVPASPPVADQQISEMGRGRFVWPLRGEIISTFGPKGTGQRNDGLNIRASAGAAVRAAAGGNVVYAGDQVPGFGNLVLVKHADGWVTAYAHLSNVDVKMQQDIVQGQQIGEVGSTGGVSEPQLHFEVRFAPSPTERARPVDPQLVLPK